VYERGNLARDGLSGHVFWFGVVFLPSMDISSTIHNTVPYFKSTSASGRE
jgi:hypothetical protein